MSTESCTKQAEELMRSMDIRCSIAIRTVAYALANTYSAGYSEGHDVGYEEGYDEGEST